MRGYVLRRTLTTIPIIVLTTIVIFVLMRVLPGDPVLVLAGQSQASVSAQTLQQLRHQYGLDQPIPVQYGRWIAQIVSGDRGRSIQSDQPVLAVIKPALLPTVQIGLMALLLSLIIALPVGIISAVSPNSWKDLLGTLGALVGAAVPYFLLAGALIYFVALKLRWLPASGYVSPFTDPVQSWKSTILPAITLGLGSAAVTTRQIRSSLLEVLRLGFITTAHAKGLRERQVILRHALKNALLPVVTLLGIQVGLLLGGAVITETIFSIPGIGRLLVDSIFSRDYPVVQGIVLIISFTVIVANFAVDLIYGYLDPRIRY